jgi:hypothetical protein
MKTLATTSRKCGPQGSFARRLCRSVLALSAAVSVCALGSSAGATSAGRVTFGLEPSSSVGPNGYALFSYAVTPGGFVSDHVALVNYSSVPLTLNLYATDAVETPSGGFGLLLASQKPTGVGSWVSLAAKYHKVTVPSQRNDGPGILVVPFSMHVPITTTPGDHVGGIVASLRTRGVNSSGQNIILDQRVGSRLFVRVAGALHPSVEVRNLRANYVGTWNPVGRGQVRVSFDVVNNGNVDLSLAQVLSVSSFVANSHHVKLANEALLLSGSKIAETAVVNGVWPQFIAHATVRVTSHQATSTLVPVQNVSVRAQASTFLWTVPYALLILIGLFIALAVAWRQFRPSRRVSKAPLP